MMARLNATEFLPVKIPYKKNRPCLRPSVTRSHQRGRRSGGPHRPGGLPRPLQVIPEINNGQRFFQNLLDFHLDYSYLKYQTVKTSLTIPYAAG